MSECSYGIIISLGELLQAATGVSRGAHEHLRLPAIRVGILVVDGLRLLEWRHVQVSLVLQLAGLCADLGGDALACGGICVQ